MTRLCVLSSVPFLLCQCQSNIREVSENIKTRYINKNEREKFRCWSINYFKLKIIYKHIVLNEKFWTMKIWMSYFLETIKKHTKNFKLNLQYYNYLYSSNSQISNYVFKQFKKNYWYLTYDLVSGSLFFKKKLFYF